MQKRLKVIILVMFSLLLSNFVLASPEIMPLSEVESGMQGVGKTVLRGTKIESFGVEIVSIIKDQQANQDLILVKTSGDVIERTGGIASGMSGSPVYIDGKLIGAIGYGWQMANHKIGMVTPIENMLDLFTLENKDKQKKEIELPTTIKIGNNEYKSIYFTNNKDEIKNEDGRLIVTPVQTPLLVSGLSGRAKDRLAKELKNYDLLPVQGGSLLEEETDIALKAGSAVAIQLVRGDINVSAIGTLTYRDKNKILALGHPFLAQGKANYLLSAAYIHQMITSVKMPFKIGSPAGLKGMVTQDRKAGLAGKIGEYPNVIPLKIEVVDKDLKRSEKYDLQIVRNDNLLQNLAASVVLQAIDSTIDRKGAGTATMKIEILGNNLPDNVIEEKNIYYSGSDVAAVSLADFLQGLNLIINNPFEKVNLGSIKFKVEIEEEPKVALIEEVKLNKKVVKPGEKVTAELILRPYRKNIIKKEIEIEIPKDIEASNLEVYILSGQEANLNQITSQQQNKEPSSQANNIKTLEELVELYQKQKSNNQLVVELRPAFSSHTEVKEEAVSEMDYNENLFEKTLDTEYVLEGSLVKEIEVEREDKKEDKKTPRQ